MKESFLPTYFMRRLFNAFLALFIPWIIFLGKGRLLEAFIVLILQATLIGWPIAIVWAWRVKYPKNKPPKPRENQE